MVGMMYLVMKEVVKNNKVLVVYIEDEFLLFGGVMYVGKKVEELGFFGILSVIEFF